MAAAEIAVASINLADHNSDKISRIEQLLSIRKSITSFFRGKSDELKSIRECRTVSIDYILDFAQYTTFTLRAPEGWTPGMPLIGGHPPAPQPDQMRDGVLQRFNQQRPVTIALPPLLPTKEMRDIVRIEPIAKSLLSTENISLKTKRSEAIEVIALVVEEQLKLPPPTLIEPAIIIPKKVVEDQQPHKRARQINISFGLSDSESSDEEG